MMSVMVNLVLAFLCIKAPAVAKRIGPTRKVLVVLSCLNTFAWAPIIILLVLAIPKYALLFLGIAWLINLAPSVLIELLRDSWLANLIPSDSVGRYLGKRMAITSIFYLGTFLMMGYMLDNSGLQLQNSFAAIFTVAFVASLASFFIYSRMHETPQSKEAGASLGFSSFMNELKDKKLSRFTLFVSLFRFTVNFVGPLYAVYMLNELHFSYSTYAIVVAAEYLARITTVRLWGRLADRVGNIKVITLVSRLIPILPILWLFSSNAIYLVLVQAMSGVCWAAFDLCNQGYIYKVAPASKKMLYVVYSRSIGLACIALGGLFGVYLLKTIPPLGGSQIPSIFILSGIFRLAVVVLLAHQLIDYALPLEPGKVRSFDVAVALRRMAQKVGLYYHPDRWGNLAPAPVAVPVEGINPSWEAPASNLGLYHQPEEWQNFTETTLKPAKTASIDARAASRFAAFQADTGEGAAPVIAQAAELSPTSVSARATARLATCQAGMADQSAPVIARATELSPTSVSARAASRRAAVHLSPEEWQEIVGIAPQVAVSPAGVEARAKSRIAHSRLALIKQQETAAKAVTLAAKASARMAKSKHRMDTVPQPPPAKTRMPRLQPALAYATVSV